MRKILFLLLALSLPVLAQDWAKARLEKSPRHLEWVNVQCGKRTVQCFVAYPEVKGKAPCILIIHEIFGLTDWVRSVADQLAEAGYVVIAPDLLSGLGPKGGGTAELGGDDGTRKVIGQLPPDQITADLQAVSAYVTRLPASSGQLSVVGFCWGGGQSFRFASNHKGLRQAFVFYGPAPTEAADLKRIACPVYGFYAENDARINQTLDDTKTQMKTAAKTFEPKIYPGAGHGFMRAGQAPDATAENRQACEDAWKRLKELLSAK